jgi:hypothetical protein
LFLHSAAAAGGQDLREREREMERESERERERGRGRERERESLLWQRLWQILVKVNNHPGVWIIHESAHR